MPNVANRPRTLDARGIIHTWRQMLGTSAANGHSSLVDSTEEGEEGVLPLDIKILFLFTLITTLLTGIC